MDPARYFSDDYTEAVAKFRAAAEAQGLAAAAWPLAETGPAGERLETLSCQFGPADAANVLVLNSGTHGTEAFVGAGLLTGILADPDAFLANHPDTRVVMIHIINPYGAAWGRYVNENNVDLMKNLTYGDRLTPTDPVFIEFDDAVDLASLASPEGYEAASANRRALIEKHGQPRLMRALKRGQSVRPDSLCFNGAASSWSKRTLDSILAETLEGARRALFLDLHSGVGGWGQAYVMTAGDAASQQRVAAWLGEDAHKIDLPMDPPALSTLADNAPGVEFTAAIIEGGTVEFGPDFTRAMWLEMYHHLRGDRGSAEALENKKQFKSYYYPASDEWRRLFWTHGTEMIERFLTGLTTHAQTATA